MGQVKGWQLLQLLLALPQSWGCAWCAQASPLLLVLLLFLEQYHWQLQRHLC
jgi:hypothetical protein